jgi:hypothetical protein
MAQGFVIGEYASIKKEFPEIQASIQALRDELITKATQDWAPKTFGGFTPTGDQFGETTILPPLFVGQAGTVLSTWNQTLTATGSQYLLRGSRSDYTIPEDYKVGWIGLLFADKAIRVSELKWQVGQYKFGRVNIEEIMCYEKPALVFEEGFILDEEEGLDLWGYVLTMGQQRIVPLGFQLNRIPNKTQVTNPGAPL